MPRETFVAGVGITKFEKPFSRDWDYPDMAREAGQMALADAGIDFEQVEQACAGYVYGESTCGQRAVYELGMTGIPVYNVNNNCSTGSTALFMARQLVAGGIAECVLAIGFEKMQKGSLAVNSAGCGSPLFRHMEAMQRERGASDAPPAPQLFGNAAREHMERYGSKPESFARIGMKNHRHSVNNPYAQFQREFTFEEVMASPMIYDPLTRLQCCPTSDGAAAAIIVSGDFAERHGLRAKAVEIAGMAMATDLPSTFADKSCIKIVGFDMTRKAALQAYEESGIGPENAQVIELHDCFSANELLTYEALGLCAEGHGGELIDSGAVTYGGRWVVNPSGGLISKGHPLGATGLAQCAELVWQLRGKAEARQVNGARVALQHNLGLGGAAVVTIYRKTDNPN